MENIEQYKIDNIFEFVHLNYPKNIQKYLIKYKTI